MTVRPACSSDLPAILDILNREIREGAAHFGLEEITQEDLDSEFALSARDLGAWGAGDSTDGASIPNPTSYPWWVAADESGLLGFARASRWKSRGAYSRTAEVGVYAAPMAQGRGIGTALYAEFLPACEAAGFHTLLAGIRLPNDACVRLHEGFGFAKVGVFPEVGFKFGRWHDVGYWVRVVLTPPLSSKQKTMREG